MFSWAFQFCGGRGSPELVDRILSASKRVMIRSPWEFPEIRGFDIDPKKLRFFLQGVPRNHLWTQPCNFTRISSKPASYQPLAPSKEPLNPFERIPPICRNSHDNVIQAINGRTLSMVGIGKLGLGHAGRGSAGPSGPIWEGL